MPDPWHYLQAIVLAGFVSELTSRLGRPVNGRVTQIAAFAAPTLGAIVGLAWLHWLPPLQPVTALDRLLLLVVPAAVAVEAILKIRAASQASWVLRGMIAFFVVPAVLYGSSYTTGSAPSLNRASQIAAILLCGTLISISSQNVRDRIGGANDRTSVTVLSLSILATGIAMVLTGYLRGGVTALVIATAVGCAVSKRWSSDALAGVAHLGWLVHVGLLLVGSLFGRLGMIATATFLLAPLAYVLIAIPNHRVNSSFERTNAGRWVAGLLIAFGVLSAALSGSFLSLR